jgi:glycosyltransferase involved in cell wall biosynthesis
VEDVTPLSIVCFAHDWNGDPTSKTHIMRILARSGRVLWVNSIGMRRPRASSHDLRRLGAKLRRGLTRCREVEPGIFVAHPLTVPLPGFAPADRLNAALLAASLRRLCRRHGLEHPILWSFLPNVDRLIGRLGESMVVYHCVDEYSAFTGVPRQALRRMEREMVRRADLVLTSAESLCADRRPLNPHTYFVPHGVDVEHFARALDPATAVPADLAGLPRPVVGFFGLVADWVDLAIVRRVADAHPDWSIALIGRVTADLAPLRGARNVHLLGQRAYADLPAYCRGFDVGIIPFRANELTLRANPLKLREYLAAGLPVVSTPLPEVDRYRDLVELAADATAFVGAVERAVRERSETARRFRLEAMRGESWASRVQEMSALIERHRRAAALAS